MRSCLSQQRQDPLRNQERRRAPYPSEIPDLHQRRETLRAAATARRAVDRVRSPQRRHAARRVDVSDEVAALVLKALATRVRDKATDVIDGWRCLEVAFAAGVKPSEFTDRQPAEATAIIRSLSPRETAAA